MKVVLYKPSLIRKGVDIKAIYSSKTGLYLIGTEFQLRSDKKVIECKARNPKLLDHYSIIPDDKIYVVLTDVWVDIFSDLSCIGEVEGDEVKDINLVEIAVDVYEMRMKSREIERETMRADEKEVKDKFFRNLKSVLKG